MIKAVIFDMNGVIIDDEHIHEMAFRETVRPYGMDLTHETYLDCCLGKTDKEGFESLAEKFHVSFNPDDLVHTKSAFYFRLFPENKKDFPGVVALIQSLSEKFTLALTSSASRKEVDMITQAFDIAKYFTTTVSADDVKKGKPDPEPYTLTANKLGLKPEECVVIEDSRSGVRSAKAAGCYCIAITTTHTKDDLQEADVVFADFSEINDELIHNLY